MKCVKKVTGLLLALAMVLAMAVSAFAEEENGSITINDAVVGQTYTVYRILDLESYNAEANAYAYKAAEAWKDFINSDAVKGVYLDVDDQGYVKWHNNLTCTSEESDHVHTEDCYTAADAAAFAKLALTYAKTNTVTSQGSQKAETSTVSFTELTLGYYLVDTTLGTLCSLDTTNPTVEMFEKNEIPTNVKTVEEDSTGEFGGQNDADIGQKVNFKNVITAQPGAENYIFHDKMSEGLTLIKTSIKVNDAAVTDAQGEDVSGDSFTVSYPSGADADGCTFEIAFSQTYLDAIDEAVAITITYSAVLNENAVVGSAGNPNESRLSYGEIDSTTGKPGFVTPPSQTVTYTWDVDVFKYAMNGETEKPLANATFTLSKNSDGSEPIQLISEGNNVYRPARTDEEGAVTEITTDGTGRFTITGLDSDTYYLTETAAPSGYNKLAGSITVKIENDGVINKTEEAPQGVSEVKVLNRTGTEMPSTGGIGTTIFYILGSVLVVAAVVLLVTKKRMGAKN